MNRKEALSACKSGGIAACVSGVFTLAVFSYASLSNAEGFLGIWNDPTVFFDIVIIFGLAYGMFRRSRASAIAIFIYFILGKVVIALESGATTGIVGSIIFLYFFGKAIQGSFTFHKLEKAENPDYVESSKVTLAIGSTVGVLLIAAVIFGISTMTGYLPQTLVVEGTIVTNDERKILLENKVLFPDEEIEYFYSYGLTSIIDGGSVLSDRAVISYWPDDSGEMQVYGFTFDQIRSVELMEQGNWINDSVYRVNGDGEENWISLVLSTEDSGDVRFVEALRRKLVESN